jgi:hypothetical protein
LIAIAHKPNKSKCREGVALKFHSMIGKQGLRSGQIEGFIIMPFILEGELDALGAGYRLSRKELHVKRDDHIELRIIKRIQDVELDQIFLVTHRRPIERSLDPAEIAIVPHLGIIAHHLSFTAVDGDACHADSCTIDDGVIKGEHLENIAFLSIEEVYSATEGNLIEPLQIEEGAVVRKGSILPKGSDFLDVVLAPVMLLIGEDEISDYIVAAALTSPLCRHLEEAVLHLTS